MYKNTNGYTHIFVIIHLPSVSFKYQNKIQSYKHNNKTSKKNENKSLNFGLRNVGVLPEQVIVMEEWSFGMGKTWLLGVKLRRQKLFGESGIERVAIFIFFQYLEAFLCL